MTGIVHYIIHDRCSLAVQLGTWPLRCFSMKPLMPGVVGRSAAPGKEGSPLRKARTTCCWAGRTPHTPSISQLLLFARLEAAEQSRSSYAIHAYGISRRVTLSCLCTPPVRCKALQSLQTPTCPAAIRQICLCIAFHKSPCTRFSLTAFLSSTSNHVRLHVYSNARQRGHLTFAMRSVD
jgi:hypothetical protein